ncbi:MAG: BMP family lipoprotein [Candidatus Hodarchaeales archaeon]
MNKIRTIGVIVALLVSIFALSGCTETGAEFEFAIIFATGGLGDKSFNDAGYRGLVQANETYGDRIKIDYVEPETIPEFATFQNDLADTGKYDLIICIGFLQTSALNESARAYPNQKWVLIDDVLNLTNVNSITFKEHEGSFLVGAMAAMSTNTSKLGFLGGLDIYLINKFRAGYEQGAHYVNSSINVTSVYSPDPTNPWGDISGGKQVAQTLYSQGIDIIYAAAGGTGLGVYEQASKTADVMAIGVDSDQDYLYPGKILCSMLKKVETAVFTSIKAIVDGTWVAGHTQLGVAEDGVGISPMTYTQNFATGTFVIDGVSKTRWEWILDIKAKIIAGTITVSDTPT